MRCVLRVRPLALHERDAAPLRLGRRRRTRELAKYCGMFTLLDLCVSTLQRGHANIICIVTILTDDPRRESER